MSKTNIKWVMIATGAVVTGLALTPASSTYLDLTKSSQIMHFGRAAEASFTPAGADPKLAAVIDQYRVKPGKFAFTPASTRIEGAPISVTVAVRSTPSVAAPAQRLARPIATVAPEQQPGSIQMMPMAYQLGSSVGWRSFSTPGKVKPFDVAARVRSGSEPKLGVDYAAPKRLTTKMQLESEAFGDTATRAQYRDRSIGVDLEGSYRLTRKLNLTAGVKYKAERDRLDRAPDAVRDNQAVYIGTRFKF